MRQQGAGRRYRHVDAALLRASAHGPLLHAEHLWPGPGADGDIESWRRWVARVWADRPLAEAVALASPVLADRVDALCAGHRPPSVQLRRIVLSLARYLARMRGRATPFGAFAGVAPLRFGADMSMSWRDDHHVRLRPDAQWLAAIIARLERCRVLLRRLPVVANNLAVVRGARLVAPWQPHASSRSVGVPAEVSVRNSQRVQEVLQVARSPIPVADLIDKLFPDAAAPAEAMVAELVSLGVLITSLRPPATAVDGLAYVLHRLNEVDAALITDVAPLVAELRQIHSQLQAAGRGPSWADGQARRAAALRMRQLSHAAVQPLMADLRLSGGMILPSEVAVEAAKAAEALLRLSPTPSGHPGWLEYHARFLERFGLGAVVAVEQLVDPVAGLGFPRHYATQVERTSGLSRRDEQLLILAQQAALDGAREVVLDDAALEGLAGAADRVRAPAHIDVCVDVRAPTVAALTHGMFTLAVTGVGRTALATAGRFLDVLPEADRRRMASVYEALPTGVCGAVAAQLSFPPPHLRTANVVRSPQLLPDVISLAEHPDRPGRVDVRDLAVTVDQHRMYVVSLSRRTAVEPVVANAAARYAMPPLARLLFELPRATAAAVFLFDWGAADGLPFRPRIRYGRSILSPARWRIQATALPGRAATWPVWTAAVRRLRQRLRLPDTVHIGTADQRLRLNLDDPMDLTLLRAHLDAAEGPVTLAEAPTAADHGWFDGRVHEIVIPLAATTPPAPAPAVLTGSGPVPLVGREDGVMPGSRVTFAKLYGHPDGFDTILVDHLPRLIAAWDIPPMWWFVRYEDPYPHLRLRLHHNSRRQVVTRLGAWAEDLRRCCLIGELTLATYHPETGRYGSGPAMAAAEALFAADSAAVRAQLAMLAGPGAPHPYAVTAASLVDLAGAVSGSRSAGVRWLLEHPHLADGAGPGDRSVLREAVTLAQVDSNGDRPALLGIPGGAQVAAAWRGRRDAAEAYVASLDDSHVTPGSVGASLLHLHHVRAHGLVAGTEAQTHRLARAVALADTARQAVHHSDPIS